VARYILDIVEVVEFLDTRLDILRDLGFSKSSIIVRAFGPMLLSIQREPPSGFSRMQAGRVYSGWPCPATEITEVINRHLESRRSHHLVRVRPSDPEVGEIIRIISDTSVLLGEAVLRQIGTLPPHAVAHVVLANGLIITV